MHKLRQAEKVSFYFWKKANTPKPPKIFMQYSKWYNRYRSDTFS